MKRSLVVASIVALSLVGAFLWAVIPRGRIDGPAAAPPSDWSFVSAESPCLLEFHPAEPRSVRVDCYPYRGELYVHSHRWALGRRPFGESWAQVVSREPAVRVRLVGQVYELEATLISNARVRQEVLTARGFDRVPSGIQLFRLRARE
jgi:hypothetical protein